MFHATASQRQLASLVSNNCICNHIHYTTNVVQHNAIHFCLSLIIWILQNFGKF